MTRFRRPTLAVALLAAFAFFYQLGDAPLNDWDEAWHAQVSREILTSGEWLTLHSHGKPYFNKPPLTFWMRAIAFRIGGVNETTARFFPALFGWATTVGVAWFATRAIGGCTGFLAGSILATSALFCTHHCGRSGEADSTVIFFSLLTFIALWRANRAGGRWLYIAGALTALGWMAKGSAAFLPWLGAGAAAFLDRRRADQPRWFWRHAIGALALTIALTAPWQAAMLLRHGRAFVNVFYVGEGAMPALQVVEDHHGGLLFYPRVLHMYFQPWFALAAAGVLAAVIDVARRSDAQLGGAALRWCAAWAVAALVACSAFATKMIWYICPALPALAIVAAATAVALARRNTWLARVALVATAALAAWQVPDVGLARPLIVGAVALSGLVLVALLGRGAADESNAAWQVAGLWLGLGLGVPLACHGWLLQRTIVTGTDPAGELRREPDEPWREVAQRIGRELPGRRVVLVEVQEDTPAPYFYLSLAARATELRWETAAQLDAERPPHGTVLVVRREWADGVQVLGARRRFDIEALRVFTVQ